MASMKRNGMHLLLLATKKSDTRLIGLVSNRFADPLKAVPITSIVDLKRKWIPLTSDKDDLEDAELRELKLKCQEASIVASIRSLGESIEIRNESDISSGKVVVASIDGSYENEGGAILVAAAYVHHQSLKSGGIDQDSEENNVQLRLGENNYDVSDMSKVMILLDKILTKESSQQTPNDPTDSQINTTKDVQNLIDRHILNGDVLILFASADVKLEQRVLSELGKGGSVVHCHINNECIATLNVAMN